MHKLLQINFDKSMPVNDDLTPRFAHSGLQFTASALRLSINNPSEELNASFLGAYKAPGGLSTHHGYLIRKGTEVAIKSGVPYRKDFYAKLGENQAEVNIALEKEVKALENVVDILLKFQSTPEAQWK